MINTEEFIMLAEKVKALSFKLPLAKVDDETRKRGLEVSRMASRQPEEVVLSPFLKNYLMRLGDLKEGQRLMVDDPLTPGEKKIVDLMKEQLAKQWSDESDEGSLSSKWHKITCTDNLKENMRHQVPGQSEQRLKLLEVFAHPTANVDLINKFRHDPILRAAIDFVMDHIPYVASSDEFKMVFQPFEKKDSNVGPPYYKNDKLLMPDGVTTYGEWAIETAKKTSIRDIIRWNIFALYGKNERGKGRFIAGGSRVQAVFFNRLNANEQAAYKLKSPIFAGWNDREYLRNVLSSMAAKVHRTEGWGLRNDDLVAYDSTVIRDWWYIIGAISILKCTDARGKELALYRAATACQAVILNGPKERIETIYGRILSGYIDTQRAGTLIRAISMVYCHMCANKDWKKTVYDVLWSVIALGDDILMMGRKADVDAVNKKMMADFGFEQSKDKAEVGAFFLQWRLFINERGEKVFTYPWTRVMRNILYKKEAKGLGPAGWVLAAWQSLDTIKEDRENFKWCVNFLLPLDELRLGTEMTVSDLIKMVQREDEQAASKATTSSQKRRLTSTADKLLGSNDPAEANTLVKEEKWDSLYLTRIQDAIRSVI